MTDAAGLETQCTFTVDITDAEPPSISCPSNIAVNTASGVCTAPVSFDAPSYADNCPGAAVTQPLGPSNGSDFSEGSTNPSDLTLKIIVLIVFCKGKLTEQIKIRFNFGNIPISTIHTAILFPKLGDHFAL